MSKLTLKAVRVNKGFTQEQASKMLGISEGTLRSYEKGRTFPSVDVITAMEELYGVSYDQIIFLPSNTV